MIATLTAMTLMMGAAMEAPPTTKSATPEIKIATADQLHEAIAEQKGNVVVVNFWATWCKPCVEELPDFVKLHEKYHDKGVRILGFSADALTGVDDVVRPFLKKTPLPYPVYVIDMEDDPSAVIGSFGEWFGGSLPTTVVYNRDGEPVAHHEMKTDYAGLEKMITPVLAE